MAISGTRFSIFDSPIKTGKSAIAVDANGDTPLHRIIRTCHHAQEALTFISQDIRLATRMTTMVNHLGDLPYDLIDAITLPDEDKNTLAHHLFSLMISQRHLMKLTEILDLAEIKHRYRLTDRSDLSTNIEIGVEAANYARSIIWQSSTHPEVNAKRISEIKKIIRAMMELRGNPFFPHPSEVSTVKQKHTGNCLEHTLLVFSYLRDRQYQGNVEVICIKNGDHVFIVLGRNPASDVDDYKTWGPNSVVCDAWKGAVYPASDIENCLGDSRKILPAYRRRYSHFVYYIITNYNPHFHQLERQTLTMTDAPSFKI